MIFLRLSAQRVLSSISRWPIAKRCHSQAFEETIKVPWGHISVNKTMKRKLESFQNKVLRLAVDSQLRQELGAYFDRLLLYPATTDFSLGVRSENKCLKERLYQGKRWGKESSQPVIALHGMFDNAASFDRLMPLLNIGRPVLALDIPAYGRSSNPPPGMQPNILEIILWLRYLFKWHFKWEKVSLIGHSLGSNLSFIYSALYPDEVDKYVSIDCSRVNMASRPEFMIDDYRKAYEGGARHAQGVLREGLFEEFLQAMVATREKAGLPISEEHCKRLLPRDLEEIDPNHYQSIVDTRPRLRYIGRMTLPFLEALSKKIKCDSLMIKASQGVIVGKRLEVYDKHLEHMKNNGTNVTSHVVEGGHHVHIDNPKDVASLINLFFNR